MAAAIDFLEDENGDDLIVDGDYAVGESDKNHIDDIIISVPGSWREFPQVGVGITTFQSSSGQQQKMERLIKQQLEADGYSNVLIDFVNKDNTFALSVAAERQ